MARGKRNPLCTPWWLQRMSTGDSSGFSSSCNASVHNARGAGGCVTLLAELASIEGTLRPDDEREETGSRPGDCNKPHKGRRLRSTTDDQKHQSHSYGRSAPSEHPAHAASRPPSLPSTPERVPVPTHDPKVAGARVCSPGAVSGPERPAGRLVRRDDGGGESDGVSEQRGGRFRTKSWSCFSP